MAGSEPERAGASRRQRARARGATAGRDLAPPSRGGETIYSNSKHTPCLVLSGPAPDPLRILAPDRHALPPFSRMGLGRSSSALYHTGAARIVSAVRSVCDANFQRGAAGFLPIAFRSASRL